MPSRYSPSDDNYGDNYGDNYDEPRTSQRRRSGRVQEVSDAEIDYIRRRERAAFRYNPERGLILRPQQSQDDAQGDNDSCRSNRRTSRKQRSTDDQDLPPPDYGRSRDNADYQRSNDYADYRTSNGNDDSRRTKDNGGRRSRRRNSSPSSDRESSRGRRNRGEQGRQRARSEGAQGGGQGNGQSGGQGGGAVRGAPMNNDEAEQEGRLWYSCKDRKDGSFLERHFDSSYDGLFAAAAGAALGAMTVRRLGTLSGIKEEENKANETKKRWKIAAGAVAGAAAVNAGENWFRVYTEDKGDRREHIATGMEFAGECMEAFA